MSSKISALPSATAFASTDVVAGLQAGANVQCTRAVFLTASPAETVQLNGGGSQVSVDSTGYVLCRAVGASVVQLQAGATNVVTITGVGGLGIATAAGATVVIQANAGSVQIDAAGNVAIVAPFGSAVTCTYTPATPGDWVVPPTDLLAAVDRIARVVSAFGVVPIP